jgi:hypothetical protein
MLVRPFLDEWVRTQLSDGDVESAGYFDQYRDAVNRPHASLHLREPALRPAEEPSELDLGEAPAAAVVGDALPEWRGVVHAYGLCAWGSGTPLPT